MPTTVFPYSPVNQVPDYASTATPQVPTGSNGAMTYLREAPYINAWIAGPGRQVQVPWITALRIQENIEDFQLVQTSGTFVRQPKAGSRLFTITLTRFQGVYQTFKALIRAAYAAPQGSDIRGDRNVVALLISYELQGSYSTGTPGSPGASQPVPGEQWQFPQAWIPTMDTGLVTSATSASDETITLLATADIYIANGGIQLTSQPQPNSGWPNLVGPATSSS